MKLQIIISTTRPNRTTPRLADWIAAEAKNVPDVEVEIIDLADYPMPFLDEPMSPRFNSDRRPGAQVQKWIDKIAEGGAYIFVTPEYNHSIPGVLKNAIDYLAFEMAKKPATVASHGAVGGARAAMHLKEILSESKAAVIPTQLAIVGMGDKIDENGNLSDEQKAMQYGPATALKNMLEELKWYSGALAAARSRSE